MAGNTQRCARGRSARRRTPRTHRGFSLIETALATVIVGVGVLAMVSAQQAFHKQNHWSTHASIAERLGNEIREMTLNLPARDPVTGDAEWGPEINELWLGDYDDIDDFDGDDGSGLLFSAAESNGPINGRREIIQNMVGWAQIVRVFNVDPFDISGTPVADGSSTMMMVEVEVTYEGPSDTSPQTITTVSWIVPE